MKLNNKIIDEINEKMNAYIPSGLKSIAGEFENNLKSVLKSTFERLELVTREEFDIQQQVLFKTRQKLEALEKQVDDLLKQNNIDI